MDTAHGGNSVGDSCGGYQRKRFLGGYIRKQAEESIKSATEFYARQMDTTFRDINDYMGELVFQDKDVAMTRYASDTLLFIQAVQKINEKLEFYRVKLGGDFTFLFIIRSWIISPPRNGENGRLWNLQN